MKLTRVLSLLVLPALVLAGTIDISLNFSASDLSFTKWNGYDVVTFVSGDTIPNRGGLGHVPQLGLGHVPEYYTTELGKPMLPLGGYSVLIPPDAEITGVAIVSQTESDIPGEFNLLPAQKPVALTTALPRPAFVPPDAATYNSNQPYPSAITSFSPSGSLSGFRIAGVNVSPLQYVPATGKLRLFTHLSLRVTYKEGAYPQSVRLTTSQRDLFAQEVSSLVLNPEQVNKWSPSIAAARDGAEWDMIVITDRSIASSFQPFADWKTKKGYRTKIIGTDSIYAEYPGIDNQTRIRNCITDYWQNHGLKYVLLGGDEQFIPDRKCHLTVEGTPGDIPADMYYADLKYSWDSDHNGLYGEMTDSVDLYHDVYIGRVPANRAADVATFLKKDTMFEKHPDTLYLKSLLLPSEMLFDPYHGKVANNLIAATFPSGWKISRLEDPGPDDAMDSLRLGYEFCHMCCHGNYDVFGDILSIDQVPSITSGNRTCILNANSCMVGEFDDEECIAESLVRFNGGACVAEICNSRYGYGYPPAIGTSEMIDLEYYRQMNYRGCYELGAMNARSKDWYHASSMDQEVWRWCIYELTLFGDPSLPVWTERPSMMAVSYASSVSAEPQTMRVSVGKGGSPLANAQVCLMMGSSVYAVGRTNSLGWVDLFISPTTAGTMNLTVTAHDCRPFESTCSVVTGSSQPAVTLQSVRIVDDGNHNGLLDPGETAQLFVTLRNSGNATATAVNGVLRTTGNYVTLSDSLNSYGTMAAGDTSPGAGYQLAVSSATPQGTDVEFYVHATGSEGSWDPFFVLTVGTKPNRRLWMDHDTGNVILSVTSFGSIGTIAPYNEGSGMKYPRNVSNGSLYGSSFMCGTDTSYVVDRFYGCPSTTVNNDWRVLDTVHREIPPEAGAQEYRATYDDGNHPRARGLTVQQWSASTNLPGYDAFVVLQFDLWNYGASPIDGLYAGVMTDFDVYNVQANNVTFRHGSPADLHVRPGRLGRALRRRPAALP